MPVKSRIAWLCVGSVAIAVAVGAAILAWPANREVELGSYEHATVRAADAARLSQEAFRRAGVPPEDFELKVPRDAAGLEEPFWVSSRGPYTLWHPRDVAAQGSIAYAVFFKVKDGKVTARVEKSK